MRAKILNVIFFRGLWLVTAYTGGIIGEMKLRGVMNREWGPIIEVAGVAILVVAIFMLILGWIKKL